MARHARHIYEFGPYRLIPEERQLLREGEAVALMPKAFDLLVVMVESAGHLVEKDELMRRVWPDSFVEEANLSVKMSALRRALGSAGGEGQFIETVPRRGYRFVAPVVERSEVPAETSPPGEVPVALPPELARKRFGAIAAAAGGALLFLLLLVASGRLVRVPGAPGESAPEVHSLAVLPLDNFSGDDSQAYFADGMTEALITELAKAHDLKVIARASAMRFKGTRKSLQEIGRELRVDAIVTGSVVRSADRIRVAVQLNHVPTDRSVWTESYERDVRDVLTLQRDVAQGIVSGIRGRIERRAERSATERPVNPEAYDQFLRGQFHLHRQNRADNDAAIAALEHAVRLDPEFAAAHAELAQAYVWKFFLFTPDEKQWEEKAFVSAEKALALDPALAAAYLARGRSLWTPANRFPHGKAIREYRHALEINPSLDEAHNQLALIYYHVGAFDAALEEARKAAEIDPTNSLAQLRMAQTLNFQGKHEEALSLLRALPADINPALVGQQTAWALFNLGRRKEAAALLEQLLRAHPEDSGGLFTSEQAVLAATEGDHRRSRALIEAAIRKGRGFGHFHHTAYHIACAYALMNEPDKALQWLEAAADDGFPCYPLFERDPNLLSLRGDARFSEFLRRVRSLSQEYVSSSSDSGSLPRSEAAR